MSPRRGGEAAKFGARYEGAWTVSHLLYILAGNGRAITVEAAGEADEGAEFLYSRTRDDVVEAHQLKRQNGSANHWTVKALRDEGIWTNAKRHLDVGREFHFVSTVPFGVLADLADRARRSASFDEFVKADNDWLQKKLCESFDQLAEPRIYGTPEAAWTMLRGIWFRCQDETGVATVNAALSGVLLEGAVGELAAVGLGDLVMQHIGVELSASVIEHHLGTYGLQRASAARKKDLSQAITAITRKWRDSVGRELLSPSIPRVEADALTDMAGSTSSSITYLVGSAGGGKSAVLAQTVDKLLGNSVAVLGFRLDRQGDFGTAEELGQKLGLPVSPVAALASAAGGEPSVLVIDQLDAVSLASGRMPASFSAVEDLAREARAFPDMHVVLVCRQFDVDNDHRIRTLRRDLKAETVTVQPLSDDEVDSAVDSMGLDYSTLGTNQRELLRLPLHLVLLASVASQSDALNFQTTDHLFDAYWRRKRQDVVLYKPGAQFTAVIAAVTGAISDRQQLSVSDSVLDSGDLADDGEVLISEHVLVRDRNRIAFFHETFFDYAFARQWSNGNQTLVDFLTSGEQGLFRRAQVRQILHHLRERDTQRYLAELSSTLTSPAIRFHLKETMLAALGNVADPTPAEQRVVLDAASDPDLASRVWQVFRSPNWFARLDQDGHLLRWIHFGTADEQRRVADVLEAAARSSPDRVAAILRTCETRPDYEDWLFRAIRFADVPTSRALFDLLLDAVRKGAAAERAHGLWWSMYALADHEPAWVIDLISAYFIEWPGGMDVAADGKVARLSLDEHAVAELIKKSAAAEPAKFVDTVLPYMCDVMGATSNDNQSPGFPTDSHFSYYYPDMSHTSDADHAFHVAMRTAIASFVSVDPAAARPALERLADIRLSGAQSLLYLGLIAGAEWFADWSADLLLESDDRLLCGTMADSVWVTRQLMQAIAPHINDAKHEALEEVVRDLRFSWERRYGGYNAFTLLSALDVDRLTPLGKRRLGEYQRKFNVEFPPEPQGVRGGLVGSPIAGEGIKHMTNANWLQAIAKHAADRTDWSTLKGGAGQLSQFLQEQTKQNPLRFARLAQQFTEQTNPAYGNAVLLGLGEGVAVGPEDDHLVFAAIRHIASLSQASNDAWLGRALRPYLKTTPIDLVTVIRDRAVRSADPVADIAEPSNERWPGERLQFAGINSARGGAAEVLGDLLIFDVDGTRTTAVLPVLDALATDPVISVRAQAAHTIAGCLRYARPQAVAAFSKLVTTEDVVLTGLPVRRLMRYIGDGGDHGLVVPVVQRMINAESAAVRQCGGALSLVAALDWSELSPLEQVMSGTDNPARRGVAGAAARRISSNRDVHLAAATLITLFDDPDEDVRQTAAKAALHLRGKTLGPYEPVLLALIASPAFEAAVPQLLITLQHAPDAVDRLALRCAQRFIEVFGPAAGDIQTSAAGDSHYVCDLAIRGLAQSQDPVERAALLDVIDALIKVDAYGVNEAVEDAGR